MCWSVLEARSGTVEGLGAGWPVGVLTAKAPFLLYKPGVTTVTPLRHPVPDKIRLPVDNVNF